MGKSTISMAIFNSKLLVYQRVLYAKPLTFVCARYSNPCAASPLETTRCKNWRIFPSQEFICFQN